MQAPTSQPHGVPAVRCAALDPRRAGLPPTGGLRRVPGLRREESAHLSFDYVVRLEHDRTRGVSVLDALADALQLAADQRAYLFSLAYVTPQTSPSSPILAEVSVVVLCALTGGGGAQADGGH
ncbi:hypothetical protein [Kribbella pittospori]|uniref:hypothetical protein n=1 Tax=Kribbella pittospori TaxID=722689 RepID=UPI00192E1C91|nr:hypothetical protein [Kribbella pittospori]